MFVSEIFESLSRVAYHYTNIAAAGKILEAGEFQLSSVLGSIEQQYAPKGHMFFLSTTRTRHGGYHSYIGDSAVMFVLNGDWFNQHYISRPVDYWENRDPAKVSHRPHEAEDRVFSKEPTISTDGVQSVHVLVKGDSKSDGHGGYARKVLTAAKRRGIPVYFYEDEQAWRNLVTSRAVPITDRPTLRGQVRYRRGADRKGYLQPWIELIFAQNQQQLSKKADSLRYSLTYNEYDKNIAAGGLENDIGNARKPNAGPDRELALKIIQVMQKLGIDNLRELVNVLAHKWEKISNPKAAE